MIDADVVAVDVRAFRAISQKVSTHAGGVRKRERIYIIQRKRGKWTTARTVPQIVPGNGRTVWCKDGSSGRSNLRASEKRVLNWIARIQQLAEISDTHSGCWNRDCLRIACATKDRRGVSLTVIREKEERTITAVVENRSTLAGSRLIDWTTNSAVEIVGDVIRNRL